MPLNILKSWGDYYELDRLLLEARKQISDGKPMDDTLCNYLEGKNFRHISKRNSIRIAELVLEYFTKTHK